MSRFRNFPRWLKNFFVESELTPRLREEHKKLLLQRSIFLCWVAIPIYPFTILLYNYINHPEAIMGGLLASLPASFMAFVLYLGLRLKLKILQKYYQLPLFLILAVFSNYAESTNLQITGGGGGGFFFPYFLIFFGMAVYYPATFTWALATCFTLIIGYFGSEWIMGRDLSGTQIHSNIIYLIDSAFIALVGNRAFLQLFIKDKKNEIELESANAQLKALDEAKSNFFANVSHELKTPMTLVLSPLESVLANTPAGIDNVPISRKLFQSIRQNAYRLSVLIGDLLDLTRSEMGTANINAVPIEKPCEHLKSLCSTLAPLVDQKDIKYILNVEPNLKPHMYDQHKIDRVMVNLVTNATKFTNKGGQIEVKIWDDGDDLKISVADTGIGIPKEKLDSIFERFMQVDATSTRAYGGMGIGLSLVKDFVNQHGGKVTVTSREGKGTTFTVILPRGQEHFKVPQAEPAEQEQLLSVGLKTQILAHQKTHSESNDESISDEDVNPSADTVLIVDDTAEMRNAVQSILVGYKTITARDGVEGLEMANKFIPDLIISDIMMPRKDGYSMVKDIKADPDLKDIPVIVLTAKAGEENLAYGFAAGADDYIMKPFQPKEVLSRVGNLLKIKRQKEALEEANRNLRETQQELVQAEKNAAVGVLAAGMAHELNNPIAAIRGYVQDILDELPMDNPHTNNLRGAEKATERCKRIVDDLLTFSRESTTSQSCDINDIANIAVLTTRKEMIHENVKIKAKLEPNLPLLKVDPQQILQVMRNLINNAKDSINDNSAPGEITVFTRRENDHIIFETVDTGSGIPHDIQSKIFDPFFTTKSPGKGMGLGLSICFNVIKRYKGEISVKSEPGAGTQFTVSLPIQEQSASYVQ